MEMRINIKGLHCEHCVARVEKALNKLEGVSAKADLQGANLTLQNEISEEELAQAVRAAGYEID